MGPPEYFARRYYEDGADEIIYIDTVASLYGRRNLVEILDWTTRDVFIPVTAGGGLRTLDDINAVLRAGADKVVINTAAIHNPELINQATKYFGCQCIVISIEARRTPQATSRYECLIDNARESTGRDAVEWAREATDRGAGEILAIAVDRDGTGLGYDKELMKAITQAVHIPVIASGGAGNVQQVIDTIQECSPDALAIGSMFHYKIASEINRYTPPEGDMTFLDGVPLHRVLPPNIAPMSVNELKKGLCSAGIAIRT